MSFDTWLILLSLDNINTFSPTGRQPSICPPLFFATFNMFSLFFATFNMFSLFFATFNIFSLFFATFNMFSLFFATFNMFSFIQRLEVVCLPKGSFIDVFDGPSFKDPLLGTFTGNEHEDPYYLLSSQRYLLLHLYTPRGKATGHFKLGYSNSKVLFIPETYHNAGYG